MLSIRKLMSVVKDVDLEAIPSSIFVNDDDDDDDITDVFWGHKYRYRIDISRGDVDPPLIVTNCLLIYCCCCTSRK